MNIIKINPVLKIAFNHLKYYPSTNLFLGFGSLAGVCLVLQIITGVFLAMHYSTYMDLLFLSIKHIMRDVNNGWLVRYMHSNSAINVKQLGV